MNSAYATWAARWRVALGFLLGFAYLLFCRPTVKLLVGGGIVATAGLAVRAYAAGVLTKNQKLTMSGPYAYTRNPLYLGSSLMGVGFAIAGATGFWRWLLRCCSPEFTGP
jgi:protein-S-isoprenylcysteine O-methyltransferase Ste14